MLQEALRETKGQLKQLLEAQRQQQELLSQQQKLFAEMNANKNKSSARPVESSFYCKKPGHRKKDCYKYKAGQLKVQGQAKTLKNQPPTGQGSAFYMQTLPPVSQQQMWKAAPAVSSILQTTSSTTIETNPFTSTATGLNYSCSEPCSGVAISQRLII